jgi:hypothetical protein
MAPQTTTASVIGQKPIENASKIGSEMIQIDDKLYSAKSIAATHPGTLLPL